MRRTHREARSACGRIWGFNLIEFKPDDSVVVSPMICGKHTLAEIEANTLVFYTGISRSASALLKRQSQEIAESSQKQGAMKRMVALAFALREELQKNNVSAIGEILHENWMLKKSTVSGLSTPAIDDWYSLARDAGATGGKILGAGAGGFLMLYAPREAHERIKLSLRMLRPIPIGFEPLGSRIIFYH